MARSRGPRRLYEWIGQDFGLTVLSATQVILGVGTAETDPVTIVRNRGQILVKGTPDAVADDTVVGLGIIVVSRQAEAVGGTSVPGPIADPQAAWLWHQYVPLSAGGTALNGADLGSVVRVIIDSKAQRKMNVNESLAFIGEVSTTQYATVSVNGGIRTLFMSS